LNNHIIISAAGSRKTTTLVESAIDCSPESVLILTYTIENQRTIQKYIIRKLGAIPLNINVQTWFTFLLHDCVRPYQNYVYEKQRIANILFTEGRSALYVPKTNIERYYIFNGNLIYTDKISEFAILCNERSNGNVINRLESIYDRIFIDETQDLAGYDFDFIELLLPSRISMLMVGDPRQATYFTNYSPKNSMFKGSNITALFNAWHDKGWCHLTTNNRCYRSTQEICSFADTLYPGLPETVSMNTEFTSHNGIFFVSLPALERYITAFNPKILRDKITTNSYGYPASNFGVSKGLTFDRVLIIPSGPIRTFLKNGDPEPLADKTRSGLYVAITRAVNSVAFLYDGPSIFETIKNWG